jgi:hypothetical protein
MPAAMNGNEFHLHFRVVAPQYLLNANSVFSLGLVRFRRAANFVEIHKILR